MANDLQTATELRVYNWQSDEFLLVDWYTKLVTSGDHYQTFGRDLRHLSTFLDYFKPPRIFVYAADRRGIYFAFWLESMLSGAAFGLWIREDARHKPSSLMLLKQCFHGAFKMATVLIAYTKQAHLRHPLERLGCDYLGRVPALWDGDAVEVYTLTRSDWEARSGKHRQEQPER